jgi:hypothetical protein
MESVVGSGAVPAGFGSFDRPRLVKDTRNLAPGMVHLGEARSATMMGETMMGETMMGETIDG